MRPFPLPNHHHFGNFSIPMFSRKFLFTIIFCLLCLSSVSALAQWQVVKYKNREYVTMRSFCDFYGLRYEPLAERSTTILHGQRGRIKLSLESKDAEINGVKYTLSFPISSNGNDFIIAKTDVNALFEPILRPHKVRRKERATTVIIDAGHGGSDSGAIGRIGTEKQFTMDTAFRLKRILEKLGYRTYLTRTTDTFIPLDRRTRAGAGKGNTIFVSIHFNKGQSRASGIETFALAPRGSPSTGTDQVRVADFQGQSGNRTDEQNIILATAVHRATMKNTNTIDRGVKRARFWVLRYNTIPAILVEGGFLSNPQEARNISRESYRETFARSIAEGIIAYNRLMEGGGNNLPEIRQDTVRNNDDEETKPSKKPVIDVAPESSPDEPKEKPKQAPQKNSTPNKQMGRGLTSKQAVKPEPVTEREPSLEAEVIVKTPEPQKETNPTPSKKEKEESKLPPKKVETPEPPKKQKEKSAKSQETTAPKNNAPAKNNVPSAEADTPPVKTLTPQTPTSKDEVVVIEQKDIVIVSQPDETSGQRSQNIPTEISVSKLLEMATNSPPAKTGDKPAGN
ncbi:MAG: N-acetylmuramoyl-L-alanine amidase [Verrucomicrobiota bacterium]|nr:N-acetylmuramoyl-L-alanine amidase [Verrucomicrobiota bacterium]